LATTLRLFECSIHLMKSRIHEYRRFAWRTSPKTDFRQPDGITPAQVSSVARLSDPQGEVCNITTA
jgi:hypothetical protein